MLKKKFENNSIKYREELQKQSMEITKYIKEINELQLNSSKSNEMLYFKPGEIFSINFYSLDYTITNYSSICKNTDLFVDVEKQLYQDYPNLKDKDIYFVCNGNQIKRFRTIGENNLKKNDILTILEYSFN